MASALDYRLQHAYLLLPLVSFLAVMSYADAGMYGAHVTELTASNFDAEVINSAETWVVKFYAPWCGHCKSSAPAFSKAAKRLYGVARMGVVNCDDHGSLAQKFNVRGFPTIKTFAGEGRRARRPLDYNGERSAGALSRHARNIQTNFVARVMSDGVDSFFNDLAKLPHVLLFTDKTSTSGLYKGMAARFRKSLAFGEARQKDGSAAADRFGISSFPTILVFPPGKHAPEDAVKYSGAVDAEGLIAHFSSVAQKGAASAGEDAQDSSSKEKQKPVFTQPKAYDGEVQIISSKAEYTSKCGSRNDGRLCVLGLLPNAGKHVLKSALAEAAKRYLFDNLAFAVIDVQNANGRKFASLFGDSLLVAVRSRKGKFSALANSDSKPTIDTVTSFVDRIVGGEVRYSKLGELPEWEAEKIEASDNADDETQGTANITQKKQSEEDQCGTEPPKDGSGCSASDSSQAKSGAGASGKTEL